ncbi:BRO family protein [Paenibacillus sp. WLX2291]|uniref:BRO family protein n=1 Tax=Paenibacillus sp. WLX2291 TaxID=3296934 RepID=UPI0039843E13
MFNFNTSEAKISIIGGQPWLVAKDICAALDIDQTQTRRLDEEEKREFQPTPFAEHNHYKL